MLRIFLASLLFAAIATPSVRAQTLHPQAYELSELRGDISPEEAEMALELMFRHTAYVLHHEIGHMLINELDLPVLGREEDAADSLSTLLLLWGNSEDSFATLNASTHAWVIEHNLKGMPDPSILADEHSLDLQRAFHSVCLMIGASKERYTIIADRLMLPEYRRERCPREFERLQKSWEVVLEPHRRTEGQSTVHAVYLDPGKDTLPYAQVLRDEGFLDISARDLAQAFTIPREVGLVGRDCGHPNAYYVADFARVDFCYELAATSFNMFADDIVRKRKAAEEPRLSPEAAN